MTIEGAGGSRTATGGRAVTVLLRPARDSDIPSLVAVFVAAFQQGYPEVLPADVLATVTPSAVTGWFARWSADLDTTVAECDGVPVGFVRYGEDTEDPGDAGPAGTAGTAGDPGTAAPRPGYIAALYVHPDVSGLGIGRRLLDHAVTALTDAGRTAVMLWVFRQNARARGLYARSGFVPDGTEVSDPQWRVPQIRLRRDRPVP